MDGVKGRGFGVPESEPTPIPRLLGLGKLEKEEEEEQSIRSAPISSHPTILRDNHL